MKRGRDRFTVFQPLKCTGEKKKENSIQGFLFVFTTENKHSKFFKPSN